MTSTWSDPHHAMIDLLSRFSPTVTVAFAAVGCTLLLTSSFADGSLKQDCIWCIRLPRSGTGETQRLPSDATGQQSEGAKQCVQPSSF
jgi:hypothetical protein